MTIKNETIVDRVVERLKKQPLGDLITEEDLHDIVKQAIPKVFFDPVRKIENPGKYNETTVSVEPHIVTVMRDLLKDSAKAALETWMAENSEMMVEQWKTMIDEGVMKYVEDLQRAKVSAQVAGMLRPLLDGLNQERAKLGLNQIWHGAL